MWLSRVALQREEKLREVQAFFQAPELRSLAPRNLSRIRNGRIPVSVLRERLARIVDKCSVLFANNLELRAPWWHTACNSPQVLRIDGLVLSNSVARLLTSQTSSSI